MGLNSRSSMTHDIIMKIFHHPRENQKKKHFPPGGPPIGDFPNIAKIRPKIGENDQNLKMGDRQGKNVSMKNDRQVYANNN